MMIEQRFQTPPEPAPALDECYFYHVMDLPGSGEVGGDWDLRKTVGAYLGNLDFSGKKVLDVGTAGGFLSFEMERRGAEVVSFDMVSGEQWDIVPFRNSRFDPAATRTGCAQVHRRLENGYWYSHRALGSRARRFVGDVYDVSAEVGRFDVVVLGMILPHLRDPFRALASAATRCADTLLVTQQTLHAEQPVMRFMPDPATNQPDTAWWIMSDALMLRWFDLLGFDLTDTVTAEHHSVYRDKPVPCTAFIGKRRHPA